MRRITQLPAAQAGEHPWVDAESLDSLAGGAGDAGRNLDRLKLRDALLELNDARDFQRCRMDSIRLALAEVHSRAMSELLIEYQ